MTGSDNADGYAVPRPSKIRLKETKSERAQKLYDREIRRQKRKDHLISRANGYAVSPPRSTSRADESITPPRHLPKRSVSRDVDIDDERERMDWLEREEMDRLESNPFASYPHEPAVRIPKRYKPASSAAAGSSRDAMRELRSTGRGRGGAVPDLGMMDDDEYTSFIRDGMDRLRRLAEMDERESRVREAERAAEAELRREDRQRERREDRKRRRAERRRDKDKQDATNGNSMGGGRRRQRGSSDDTEADADVVELVRDSKATERTRYIALWQSLAGEIQQVEMRYIDIPWPVYSGRPLDKPDIKEFLFDLAREEGRGQPTKKVLRDAIRIFHPDRFFGRFLARVRENERERVKEGVEKCSRVINDLAAEEAAR